MKLSSVENTMPPKRRKHAYAGRTKKHCTQKKKLQAEAEEDTDSSHTSSTTNLTKSWERPLSKLFPDTMDITSRRASLRSSKTKRLLETDMASCSKSSQSHRREISPATDVTPQACQVPKGSLVPSSSKSNLKQVVYPSSLEPKMINDKETEQVGNSLSNHSTQMEGQNTVEAECIPHDQEYFPLLENSIQASLTFERENPSNSISMAGRSSPSCSLKLTEIVNFAKFDNDDEIDSVEKIVGGYQVRPEFEPILEIIQAKHGDIAKNCTSLTKKDRAMLLELVCGILLEIKEQGDFCKIKEDFLHSKIALLNNIQNSKMEIEWLHQGLREMLEAKELIDQCGKLKETKESNTKAIQVAKWQMEECEKEKKELSAMFKSLIDKQAVWKEKLEKAREESTNINDIAKHVKSKVKPFIHCSSPMDAFL